MKFNKLEIFGFKSFAEKLELKFSDGITAIIGPNGCGKSNIADAIRWVLGEQSSRLLRGNNMQDVIFNGTDKRKSQSYTEVSLYLDNKDKSVDINYNEIVITRKLFRSGESEYILNKQQTRLKDIIELLRKGGLGREGYSIIGQGKIDAILSQKPEERRAIFEEAAGILNFKLKKLEAERKLLKSNENLIRLNDIIIENEKLIEPLNKQKDIALKYIDLNEQLKLYNVNIFILQNESADEAKNIIIKKINFLDMEIKKEEESINEISKYNENLLLKLKEIESKKTKYSEELLNLKINEEKKLSEILVRKNNLSYINKQINKDYENKNKLNEKIIILENEINKIKIEENNKQKEKIKLFDIIKDIENKQLELKNEIILYNSNLENVESNIENLNELNKLKIEIVKNKELISKINYENSNINLNRKKSDLIEKNNLLESLIKEQNDLENSKIKLIKDLNLLNNDKESLEKNKEKLLNEEKNLNNNFNKLNSRINILSSLISNMGNYSYTIKKLFQIANENKIIKSKFLATVAQIIETDKNFLFAIETALGKSLQNLITEDEDKAKFLINFLKENKLGRATFMPLTTTKPITLDNKFIEIIKETKDCYGIAKNLVKFDKIYTNIIENLLGKTIISKDMETAFLIAKRCNYSIKVVTLQGEVIFPMGIITGGYKTENITQFLSQKQNIKNLKNDLNEIKIKIDQNLVLQKNNNDKNIELNEKVKSFNDLLQKKNIEITLSNSNINNLKNEIHSLTNDISLNEKKYLKNIKLKEEIENKLNITILNEKRLDEQKLVKNIDVDNFREKIKKHDEFSKLILLKNNEYVKIIEEINYLNNLLKSKQEGIINYKKEIESFDEEIIQFKKDIENINKEIKILENEIKLYENIDKIKLKISNLNNEQESLKKEQEEIDKERINILNQIQKLKEKKNKEELILSRTDIEKKVLEEKINDEYGLSYEDCLNLKFKEKFTISELSKIVNNLKKQIVDLGQINLNAIEDSKLLKEKIDNYLVQKNDLEKAELELKKIIKNLSKEISNRFLNQFEKIRINFINIFRELFNGGTADLIILNNENEEDNILESGIEIIAQPPEKRLQNISLLSGGEKALTAIAIIFAILKINPMPFCVFDEIEAALDDANVFRFAKYLKKFSNVTQFIVITHRKPTMELADNLYGVTMEEKGISKIVSVKLQQQIDTIKQNVV